jgi:ATP-dependent RNA helicase RhlE
MVKRSDGPRALIIAPTRELVQQIQGEIETLARGARVKSVTVYGGVRQEPQVRGLRARPDIIVACPGRLLDIFGQGAVDLSRIEILVLDEADYMFDMGFLPDVRRILKALPKERQNLMFSATMPPEIRNLTEEVLVAPFNVDVGSSRPAATIEHALYPVPAERKTDLLTHLLGEPDFKSAIVFLRTKHRAKKLAIQLCNQGHRAVALQGNMSQAQRSRAMAGFRNGQFDVLVATDIAARGIDVAGISHVINFDLPGTPDAYTHRIGRTGRSELSGKACTLVSREDTSGVLAMERALKYEIPRVQVPGFEGVIIGARRPERRNNQSGGHHAPPKPRRNGDSPRPTRGRTPGRRDRVREDRQDRFPSSSTVERTLAPSGQQERPALAPRPPRREFDNSSAPRPGRSSSDQRRVGAGPARPGAHGDAKGRSPFARAKSRSGPGKSRPARTGRR